MSKLSDSLKRSREAVNTKTAKVGGYSVIMSVIFLAILIAFNLLVSALPSTLTQYDISAARLYSLTSSTKSVVQNLDKDVTIYWICQSGEENSVVERLLDCYEALSDHVTVVEKNPDIYPTFAAQYTDEDVYNNSLIVECGEKSRYISYSEIYEYDTTDYYTTGSVSASFDGEGEITTAIDYVVSDDLPILYILTGHGETEIGSQVSSAITRANYEVTEDFSLLNVDEIPEDAAALIMNAPTSDISDEEAIMLSEYISNGGKLLVFSGTKEEGDFTNLYSLLENYGVTVSNGVVVESDRNYYAFQAPYILLPTIESSDITDALSENNSFVLVGIAEGLKVGSNNNGATVTSLLSTSDTAFSKAEGYSLTSYDYDETTDTYGPFSLAVAIEDGDGKMVYISSDFFTDDTYVSYSSGANTDLTLNALSWMIGETDSISIRSKSLDYNYLTISDSDALKIKVCLIGIIPLIYLLYGIDEVVRRRKKA